MKKYKLFKKKCAICTVRLLSLMNATIYCAKSVQNNKKTKCAICTVKIKNHE